MNLKEIGWEEVGCIHLVQDTKKWQSPVNTGVNFQDPLNKKTALH